MTLSVIDENNFYDKSDHFPKHPLKDSKSIYAQTEQDFERVLRRRRTAPAPTLP